MGEQMGEHIANHFDLLLYVLLSYPWLYDVNPQIREVMPGFCVWLQSRLSELRQANRGQWDLKGFLRILVPYKYIWKNELQQRQMQLNALEKTE